MTAAWLGTSRVSNHTWSVMFCRGQWPHPLLFISFNCFLSLWSLQRPVADSLAVQAYKMVLPLYLLTDNFTRNALNLVILQNSDSRLSVHLQHFMFILAIPVDSLPN